MLVYERQYSILSENIDSKLCCLDYSASSVTDYLCYFGHIATYLWALVFFPLVSEGVGSLG